MIREIFEKDLMMIVNISKEYGAEQVLLFGSCINDIESAQDIDIAVRGVDPQKFFIFYGKVSMMINNEVDIFDLNDVREHFYQRILSNGRIIYEK